MSVHQLKDKRWIVQHKDKDSGKLKREYFGRGPEGEKAAFERNGQLNLRQYSRVAQGQRDMGAAGILVPGDPDPM